MKSVVRIGSRDSQLALVQTQLVIDSIQKYHPEVTVELVKMKTTGDRILDRTLEQIGGKGLFVKELDDALRSGQVDITVHSYKDLPMDLPSDLPILALSRREDPRDVLILPQGVSELPKGQIIGCSSARRRSQLATLFPDNPCQPVRGNVLTRLQKLDNGEYGALVLAAAGIKRLGLTQRIYRYFSVEELIPAASQGIVAVQGRAGEDHSYLHEFHCPESRWISLAERSFVQELNGGCTAPIAAYADISGEILTLCGYGDFDGEPVFRGSVSGKKEEAVWLGCQLGQQAKCREK